MIHKLMRCHVRHTRLMPKKYQFDVNYFWLSLELTKLDQIKPLKFLSLNKFNLFAFKEKDYLPGYKGQTLLARVEDYCLKNGLNEPIQSVRLVTSVRVLGYVFNPVSFYLIKTKSNNDYAIIEIGNTFNEIKPYFVDNKHFNNNRIEYKTNKEFYISPFASMQNYMIFKLKVEEERLNININDYTIKDELEIVTSMSGYELALNDRNLLIHFFRFPLMTLQVILLIHWHAMILFFKKVPYYKKTDETEFQKGYYVWK